MLLVVDHLKKTFRAPSGESRCVVDVPRFDLQSESQVGLHGESGSGKTTFLHLISGILRPDSGTVHLSAKPFSDLPESQRDRIRAESFGYIFQTFNLLQGYTALENVMLAMSFAGKTDKEFAAHLLKRVGLEGHLRHKPNQLSTGQQQRVAVARALANRPRLVLADEPTGNLDRRNATEALALIRQICSENKTALLFVSHDREVLGQFDSVIDFHRLNQAAATEEPRP